MIQSNLIVTAKTARFVEPTKRAFYDPAFGKNLETFGSIAPSYDLQFQFAKGPKLLNPVNQSSQIATIGPDDLQSSIHANQQFDQAFGRIAVLQSGWCDHNRQNQSQAVHRHVAFASRHLFARVVAALSRLVGDLDRLAVDNGGGRRP